ncbi:MAG: hypothetical protein ACKO5F_06020 [Synechococcus sp.]
MVQWLCRLDPQELIRGEALAEEARQQGIGGWLLEVSLTAQGSLVPQIPLEALLSGESLLPFCLSCRLPATLSPRGEDHAALAFAPFLAHPLAVRLGSSPLLVLENTSGFSHPAYGPQRFRLTLQRGLRTTGLSAEPLLLLGRDESRTPLNGAFDGRDGRPGGGELPPEPCKI